MKQKNNIYIELIESFSSFLKSLSTKDINDLYNGNKEVSFEIKEKLITSNNPKVLSFNEFTAQSIIDQLNILKNRQEGELILKEKCNNRFDYEKIASILDIPFQKKDTIDRILEKIIEGTIGFRLRSQAIQGKKNDIPNQEI